MSFKYRICGFNLLSQIRLPALIESDFEKPDFEVLLKNDVRVPDDVIEILESTEVLFKDLHKNIFLISSPKIYISVKKNKDNEAAYSLLGVPLGYLLQNNGFQVLHGSAVAHNNLGFSFIGKSGLGKSSIALSLINSGFKLVTEDLCIIKDTNIYNFSDWVKSNQNNLLETLGPIEKIGIKKDSRKRSLYKLDKKYINNKKVKLKSIYFLESGKRRCVKKIQPSEAFKYLFTYAYRKNDLDSNSLKKLTRISEESTCYIYSRDIEKSLEDNARFIFDHIKEDL